jgi:hypothetical protein
MIAIQIVADGFSAVGGVMQVLLVLTPLITLATSSAIGLWWFFAKRRAWLLLARKRQWRLAVLIFLVVGAVHCVGGLLMIGIASRL